MGLSWRRAAVLAVIAAVAAAPASAGAPRTAGEPAAVRDVPSLEGAVLARLNAVRRARGLRALRRSPALAAAAGAHSVAMARSGTLAHEVAGERPLGDRLRRAYPPRRSRWEVGETIAGMSPELTAAETVRMWLDSPPHRRIILSPRWRDAGVGAVHATGAEGWFGGAASVTLVTANFGVGR